MSALDELQSVAGKMPDPAIREWKREGGKAVGFLCSQVPVEILQAAGVLPVRLRGTGCTSTAGADAHMSHLNCSFVRSCFTLLLEGRYDFLDGIVLTNSCDHVRRLHDVLEAARPLPFMHMLGVPHKAGTAAAARRFRHELEGLCRALEEAFGTAITQERLGDSMEMYATTRTLLSSLYELRKAEEPPLGGAEALAVLVAGGSLPRQRYNMLLVRLLEELRGRPGLSDYRARLMIAGSGGCDDPAWLGIIEGLGGLVVTDSLCTGSRTFRFETRPADDPLLELARAYLERPSCARTTDRVAERSEYMTTMAREYDVDGVVFQRIRYCDLWGGQLLTVRRALEEARIPMLELEREYGPGGEAQLTTRIQAFLESLEG